MIVLLVNSSVKVESVKDLIAMAKAKPGAFSYASRGIGTVPHLSGELTQSMVPVPYKGTSAIMPAQIFREIMLSLVPLGGALTQIRAKHLKPIGVTGRRSTSAASRCMNSSGDITEWLVPSRQGALT